MPYIEGETLRTRLQREQQLPIDDVIRLVTLMVAALDFAHARGVVHRDLEKCRVCDGRIELSATPLTSCCE